MKITTTFKLHFDGPDGRSYDFMIVAQTEDEAKAILADDLRKIIEELSAA